MLSILSMTAMTCSAATGTVQYLGQEKGLSRTIERIGYFKQKVFAPTDHTPQRQVLEVDQGGIIGFKDDSMTLQEGKEEEEEEVGVKEDEGVK